MVDTSEDFLQHYGIKGMRWGVTRPEGSNGRVDRTAVAVTVGKKGRLATSGGEGLPAHEDAVKAKISKQKAQKSGVDSLGNEELRGLIDRLNLEQNYSRLNPKQLSRGERFAQEASKVAANATKKAAQAEADKVAKRAADIGKVFAAAAAKAAADSARNRKPKDGGTYTVIRKALGS